jgi:CheY-like chemotaxis protein
MAHVLVIDDDEQMPRMLSKMLIADNHTVSLAKDGVEGLQVYKQKKPDLVITDIMMPNKCGTDLINDLLDTYGDVPIIAMSGGQRAVSAEFNLNSAKMLGAREILKKPFSQDSLRDAVNKALSK